jgi:methyltransferase (TIGR00027 family)
VTAEQASRLHSGQASRTADVVAFSRAAHQVLDRPLVLDDPIALRIVSERAAALLRGDPSRLERSPMSRFLRAGLVIRSRVAEDTLAQAVARGVDQYIVLGAGFDTFAYRNPHAHVRVFEVDHPATQAVKRERLERAAIPVPASLTFVPFDFTGGSLGEALTQAGFDPGAPAVVAWLGVTMYLTPEEVAATLGYLGSLAAGTTVVFDYYLPVGAVGFFTRYFYKRVLRRLEAAGEPWRAFYTPAAIRAELQRAGFTAIESFERRTLNPRYFGKRRGRLDMGTLMQIAVASRF